MIRKTSFAAIASADTRLLIFGSLSGVRAVGFNGGAAAKAGRKLLGETGLTLIDLPSSSPAFAAMPLARKAELWRPLGDFVC